MNIAMNLFTEEILVAYYGKKILHIQVRSLLIYFIKYFEIITMKINCFNFLLPIK